MWRPRPAPICRPRSPRASPTCGSPRAPVSGRATSSRVWIIRTSTRYVGVDVNESNLGRIGPRQPAEIVLEAYPDKVYKGFMTQVIPSADRQKGTVKVKVGFIDPDDKILPDLSARVNFTRVATAG